jgi:flagellin
MQINNNQTVSNANRMLGIVAAGSAKTAEKLATALRINQAADDAAGLAVRGEGEARGRGRDAASRQADD